MRAAVYARLSRKKADDELGLNISDQQSIGLQFVERRGWTLIQGPGPDGTFTDDGKGAYQDDAKRPHWEAMLAAKPDVIVVRDAARLGRNFPDYTNLLRSKARVVVWLDDDSGDVKWSAEPVSTDTEAFMSAQVGNRVYSQKIGKGVKRKVRLKAAVGAWPHGGTRPFGYHHPPNCCDDAACKPGAIIDAEAKVILEVAERWLDGASLSALCRDMTERGILTPAGKPWQYARLRAMLAGPRIAGIRTHNGVETKGTWPAIVDADLHRRLVTAASESMMRRANENGTYLLTSIVWCGACGNKMYGLTQRSKAGERVRYVCRGPEGCQVGIAGPATDEFVINRSFRAILAPEMQSQEQSQRDLAVATAEVKDLQDRVQELDVEYWESRTIDKQRWLDLSARLTSSLAEAEAREVDAKQRLSRLYDAPTTAKALAERWQRADTRERNRLLRVGVERVVVHPRVTGKGQFDPTRIEIRLRDGQVLRLADGDVLTAGDERALMALAGVE
jgi:DNA invertase Pin-like site-specific DNA recombinase